VLELRHRRLWIAASLVLMAIVVWGSLQTTVGSPTPQGFDKIEHFTTYLFLAAWFTGLVPRARWWRVVAGLLGLGLAMELGQYLMQAGRLGDPADMLANAAGIAAGMLLARLGTGGWALKVESWLPS
jgi:VanZ family protein